MVRFPSVLAVAFFAGWGCGVEPAIGLSHSAILDGDANPGDPAVVYLIVGNGACTGTVIDPYVIMTARHCVVGVQPSRVEVHTGANPSWGDGTLLAYAGDIVTAEFRNGDYDIALLRSGVDLGVEPLPYSHDMLNPSIGDTVVAIGYGQADEAGNEGPKRRGEGIVQDVSIDVFLTTAVTCYGDSGGPIFDQAGTVVGVVSGGTAATCAGGQDLDVNVGLHADWIDGYVGQGDPTPDPDPVPDPDPDPTPDPTAGGALGDPCTDANECASNACVTGDGYCTQACAGDTCPEGYECRGVGLEFYCILPNAEGGGRSRSSCAVAGAGARRGAAGPALLLVVALVASRRRQRRAGGLLRRRNAATVP